MEKRASRWLGSSIALVVSAGMMSTHAFAMDVGVEDDKKGYLAALPPEISGVIVNQLTEREFERVLLTAKALQPEFHEMRQSLESEDISRLRFFVNKMHLFVGDSPYFTRLSSLKLNNEDRRHAIVPGDLAFLTSLRNLTSLTTLEMEAVFQPIGFLPFGEDFLNSLKYLTKLKYLNLAENIIGEKVSLPTTLTALNLKRSSEPKPSDPQVMNRRREAFSDICKQLPSLPALKELFFSSKRMQAGEIREIVKLTQLKTLTLQRVEIPPEAVSELEKLSSFKTLTDLHFVPEEINENKIKHISGLTQLRRLSLENAVNMEPETVRYLGSFLPSMTNLTDLNLNFEWKYTPTVIFLDLVGQLTSLTKLSSLDFPLYYFTPPGRSALETLISALPNLERFGIDDMNDYSGKRIRVDTNMPKEEKSRLRYHFLKFMKKF